MDDSPVHEADRHDPRRDDLVGAVQGAADEALLLAVRPVGHEGPDVPGRGDTPVTEAVEAAAELEGSASLDGTVQPVLSSWATSSLILRIAALSPGPMPSSSTRRATMVRMARRAQGCE